VFGCDSGKGDVDEVGDTGSEDPGDGDSTGAEAETGSDTDGPIDSDQDGLTDDEEAELGTDPYLKDTDADSYWDSWELDEGTDPLDVNNRIYKAYWPYNPAKDELEQGSWATASHDVGMPFPRHSFVDQHGDMVDLYDFTNFTGNATHEGAYFIFDLSAQWCGPCHNVANWIAGTDDVNTSWIQDAYPTARAKIHGLRIWWITFIVQDVNGGPPTATDSVMWYNIHNDNFIPIMADVENLVSRPYGSSSFPHFFLLDPELKMEYFPPAGAGSDTDPYPAIGLVDTLL